MTKDKLTVILKKLGEMPSNSQVNSYDVYHWIQDIQQRDRRRIR